jgi:hypothetical protein
VDSATHIPHELEVQAETGAESATSDRVADPFD